MVSEAPRRITLLGATGSIGNSTLDVMTHAPAGMFALEAVASGRDVEKLARIAITHGARFAAVADPAYYRALRDALGAAPVEAAAGPQAVIEAARRPSEIVVAAITGAAGVEPTYAALARGRVVALANKESLVCAGAPFMRAVAESGTILVPMDSEHNAIFQALGRHSPDEIETMVLTASGGPFRTWSHAAIAAATPAQALAHPNWAMGPKVTIDSAGLMNKGLELIEAHYLFGIPADKLGVLVHPQSIVHGLVSFADGAVVAGLATPDMRVPIAHCLAGASRIATRARRLDLADIGALTFERPDFERFPALRVAMDAMAAGAGLPTVLNAANEVAVEAFLAGRIGFHAIATTVAAALEAAQRSGECRAPETIAEALAVDHVSRERAHALLAA